MKTRIFLVFALALAFLTSCCETQEPRSYRSAELVGTWNVFENRTCINDSSYNTSLHYEIDVTQDSIDPNYVYVQNFAMFGDDFTGHMLINNDGSFSLDAGNFTTHGYPYTMNYSASTKVLNDNNNFFEFNFTMSTPGYSFTSYMVAEKQ